MNQSDFIRESIDPRYWFPLETKSKMAVCKRIPHWIPISKRAITWFRVSTFEEESDPKLQKLVRGAFCFSELHLSWIWNEDAHISKLGSRNRKIDELVQVLNSMESLFLFGHKNGCFDGVMTANVCANDFWVFLSSISTEYFNVEQHGKKMVKADDNRTTYMIRRFTESFCKSTKMLLAKHSLKAV